MALAREKNASLDRVVDEFYQKAAHIILGSRMYVQGGPRAVPEPGSRGRAWVSELQQRFVALPAGQAGSLALSHPKPTPTPTPAMQFNLEVDEVDGAAAALARWRGGEAGGSLPLVIEVGVAAGKQWRAQSVACRLPSHTGGCLEMRLDTPL